jgi:chorismate dehydratase
LVSPPNSNAPKLCAVSYLNTVPLVWGLLHGPQYGQFDLSFALPAECADRVKDGTADIGIVPVAALIGQSLAIFRGTGIACRGAVRSILLISKVPFGQIWRLALDSSSRTSALLAQIILARRYGVRPRLITMAPNMAEMLEAADACLVIGDPALALDPDSLRNNGFHVADLGEKWVEMTGLPMVFAVWAGQREFLTPEREQAFIDSCRYGLDHIDDIVQAEQGPRGVAEALIRKYFTEHIVFELGDKEYAGMELYLKYALEFAPAASLDIAAPANL